MHNGGGAAHKLESRGTLSDMFRLYVSKQQHYGRDSIGVPSSM